MKRAEYIVCGIMGILMLFECVFALYGFGENLYWNLTYIADYLFGHDTTILPYYSVRVVLQIPRSLLGFAHAMLGVFVFLRYHEWTAMRTVARLFAATVVISLIGNLIYGVIFVQSLFELLVLACLYALTYMCKKLQDSLKNYSQFPFIRIMSRK